MKIPVVSKRKGQGVAMRGFGSIAVDDPDRMRAIATLGGQAAHEYGGAHEWTSKEAAVAGRKGGRATARSPKRFWKVSDAQVAELRASYRPGTGPALAARYGISLNYLSMIVNNRARVAPSVQA